MTRLSLLALSTLAVAACAPAGITVTTAPAPATTPGAPTAGPAQRAPVAREAAPNWHLLDPETDRVAGIAALRAERELLAGRQPRRTVVVAVIDGGVDTAHAGIRANLWSNPGEIGGTGRDDDSNGYVDDLRGWNFIGGRDGRNVHHDTYEVARLHGRCTAVLQGARADTITPPQRERCEAISRDFAQERLEAEQTLQQIQAVNAMLGHATGVLRTAITDSLTLASVTALRPANQDVAQARNVYLQLAAQGITPRIVEEALSSYESRVKYGLDPAFDPRPIVGDNYSDKTERNYGNSDIMGPDASHGSHVAGIIGAVRGNPSGSHGVMPAVHIMGVRTVPDGDERDKDVANAIRYAVDNGAHIINMSFGKGYSPDKLVVDAAVRYAEERGVLLVHAAGNDGEFLGRAPNFPNPVYEDGTRARLWIEVGASSWKGGDSLAAPFSNYGREQVDVFAPGVDIMSLVPGGTYDRNSGTSMAAPVVSGLAAMLMSYYPDLSAADVRRIILESATRYAAQSVIPPGAPGQSRVPFSTLSATGGVVNAYRAIQMAEEMTRGR